MILKDLGNLIVFDTFPLLFEHKQKIILTHLLHLEKQKLPEKLPMIFTTQKLADQLLQYCKDKSYKCVNKGNIIVVKPYEFIDIVLERRLTLQILFCTSEVDESNNVLVLIRQNGKLNFIYGGNYTDIRSAVLSDTFASWVMHGVEKLYVNLKRMDESNTFSDVDQMQKVFLAIENIIKYHPNSKIHIYLPLFGFEYFILKLSEHLPNRIRFSDLRKFYMNLATEADHIGSNFINNSETIERITLSAGESNYCEANDNFKNSKKVTINIFDVGSKCKNHEIGGDKGYYELFYSPEPSPFQLKLLCMLVKPKRIFGIVDIFNNKSIVPKYLYELCAGAKQQIAKKQAQKLKDSCNVAGGSSNQQRTTIVLGALPNENVEASRLYITDSESDDDEDDDDNHDDHTMIDGRR